jgi:hypothetical protein
MPGPDEIADMADRGEDISKYFTNKFEVKAPLRKTEIQRVSVDFSKEMLKELYTVAQELNISRQAVIRSYLRQALDQHYTARNALS